MTQRRILVCGDRNWTDRELIYKALFKIDPGNVVIHGAARGADSIAGEIALSLSLIVFPFPADWRTYGRAAGPVRNKAMLVKGLPTEVWAFHDDLANSKGTRNMVTIARKAGIPVILFTHDVPKGFAYGTHT